MGLQLSSPASQPRIVFGLIHRLAERASEITAIPLADVLGDGRTRNLAWTRFAVILVASENGKTSPQIGRVLGGRDHSTIIAGYRRAQHLAVSDPYFACLLALLRQEAAQ
jgi:chromosomal replication initiation ATPase DnaA